MTTPASGRTRVPRWPVLVVMCVGYFLVLLDVTVVNVALPRIGAVLGASVAGLQWVVDGYALALASLLLAGGTIGDLRGHKQVVLTGLAVFGVASLVCGLAPSVSVLVCGRVVQGAGAALLLPGTLAIIADTFPARDERARAIGIWAAVGSAALPAGPLLGGALVQSLGWRPVFLLNVPIVLAAAAVAARVAPTGAASGSRRLDRAGVLFAGLLLAALTFAFIQAGHGGLGIPVLVAGVLALALLVTFCLVERSVPDPILPPRLFRRPAFCAANAVAASMNLGTLGLLFVLTLYLQSVQDRSPLAAGIAVLPLFLPLVVLAPLSGRATARYGPRLPMTIGLLVAAGGVGLMASWAVDTGYLSLLPALLAWGVGIGLLTPAVVTAAVGSVEADRAGLASGVNNTARQAGGAVGIAVYGAITGPATDRDAFLAGLHLTGLLTTGLFVVGAAATVRFLGSADRREPVRPERRS